MPISVINKKDLTSSELITAEGISEKFYDKLVTSYYKNTTSTEPKLFVEVKKHYAKPNPDMKCKYSIHSKIDAPKMIASAHEDDWDLKRAMHKTFQNLSNELEHKFKDESAKMKKQRKSNRQI